MKHTLFLFCVFLAIKMNGQLFDSTKVGLVDGGRNSFFDTTLSIQHYHNFTDYGNDLFGSTSLGNQGDVRRSLLPNLNFYITPNLGINGYFNNYRSVSNLPFYNVKAPAGGIRFLTGYTKGQMFGLHFTVNPISRLNVYLDFQRINSRGRYFNQENKCDQLLLSSSYYTKQGAYKIHGGLMWNKAKNLEWGGVADTLAFQDNLLQNRELVPIQLSQTASAVRQLSIMLNQQMRLFTMAKSEVHLFYDFKTTSQSHAFTSADSIFTKNAFFEEGTIRDSVRLSVLENFAGINWSFGKNLDNPTNYQTLNAGLKHFYHIYGNSYTRQAENNFGLDATYHGIFKRAFWRADGTLLLTNSYAGTYDLSAMVGYSLVDMAHVMVGAIYKSVRPGMFTQRYISNTFIWENEFENVQWTRFYATYKHKAFRLTGGIDLLDHYLYFDTVAAPQQWGNSFAIYFGEGSGTLPLGSDFYLDSRVRYQFTTEESIVRIPNWVVREVLYYEKDIFKRAARVQTGIEFTYFSRFTSEAYMPATSIMYLQNDIGIGNYPYFNFLFNFKIKEFTFFLRMENITQGLFGYNYYAAPYYPLPDFNIRVGATWRFFD